MLFYYFLLFKGFGVFVTKHVERGSFLLEYRGEVITAEEGSLRREHYPADDHICSFIKRHGKFKFQLQEIYFFFILYLKLLKNSAINFEITIEM